MWNLIMIDSLLLKYRVRFFSKVFLRTAFVLFLVFFCFFSYFYFYRNGNAFYKKKVEFVYIVKTLLNGFNRDICNQFYIDGILYSDYFNIQNKVNRYCTSTDYTIKDLKNDILKDPWVKGINIYKKYPNKLEIKLIEYNPFAIWVSNNGEYRLIDEYGDIINISSKEVKGFENLFIVVGDNVKAEVYNIFNLLSIYNNISSNIVKIVRIGNRRWNLVFKNGTIVKLPEEDKNFFRIWKELDNIMTTCNNDNNLSVIDLRIKNKIYLKYKNIAP